MTCCLSSAAGLPCLEAIPIPAHTNEMASLPHCISDLRRVYGHLNLFRLVADTGSCSQENGQFARSSGLHYLFGLKSTQPTLFAEACAPNTRAGGRELLAARARLIAPELLPWPAEGRSRHLAGR